MYRIRVRDLETKAVLFDMSAELFCAVCDARVASGMERPYLVGGVGRISTVEVYKEAMAERVASPVRRFFRRLFSKV